jgi:hypothetical protein
MKSYNNKSKQVNNYFNPIKDFKSLGIVFGMQTKSFASQSSTNDLSCGTFTQAPNSNLLEAIDKLANEGKADEDVDLMKRLSMVRHKEVLKDTLQELQRKGSYICIYPSQGSHIYDQYFS